MKSYLAGRNAVSVWLLAVLVCGLLAAVACYGPNDNSSTGPTETYKLTIASDNASGPVGQEISKPLGVFVGNATTGFEQHGVRVDFKVTEGQATLNPSTTVTDTSGIAYTKITPLYAPGTIKVRATVFGTSLQAVLTATGI